MIDQRRLKGGLMRKKLLQMTLITRHLAFTDGGEKEGQGDRQESRGHHPAAAT